MGKKKKDDIGLKHVISAKQFTRKEIDMVMLRSLEMEKLCKTKGYNTSLSGKVMAALFYEESTRTRFSFETAMHKLGGSVVGTENAKMFSSVAKGETLDDTIRIVDGYADVIVIRHYEQGSAEAASKVSSVPVINAGDGIGEHPTQGLLDLYTIKKEFGTIDGKTIVLVGDLLHGRTVHSLAQLLSNFKNVSLVFVAPKRLAMKQEIRKLLTEKGVSFVETEELHGVLSSADVVYMTRIQKERFSSEKEYEKYKHFYVLDMPRVRMMKPRSIIMHPLPRVGEISPAVDSDHRARYFEQAENGLFVRMALLDLLLNK